MAYASCFTDTNGGAVTYFLVQEGYKRIREQISDSLKKIGDNCREQRYNGSTSCIVESDLNLAYQMVYPMGIKELKTFRDLIKPIESPDIDKGDLERRLNSIDQLAFH